MELKERKLIQNLYRFDGGTDNNLRSADQYTKLQLDTTFDNATWMQKPIGNQAYVQNTSTNQNTNNNQQSNFNYQALIGSSSTAMQDTINAYNMAFNQPKAEQLVSDAGSTNGNIMGVNYKRYKSINNRQYLGTQSMQAITGTLGAMGNGAMAGGAAGGGYGAIIGAAAGGIVGTVSSLIGRSKLKRNLEEANRRVLALNQYNRAGAMSEGLTNRYYSKYGSNTGRLYGANHGKDLKKPIK